MPINFDSYKVQISHSMKMCFGNTCNVKISNKKIATVKLKTKQEAVTFGTITSVS